MNPKARLTVEMNVKRITQRLYDHRRWSLLLRVCLAAGFVLAHARADETDIRRDPTVEVIERIMPCVINIATATIVEQANDPSMEMLRRYFGWRVPTERHEEPFSVGSGVIVDEEGYILTNFHVLEHASRVQVKLWDGRIYEADPLVYTPLKDVALLKLRTKPGEKFKAIKFARDDDLLLGETVLALGNPYGLGGSVTRGILSSKNRRPASGQERLTAEDCLQTDADINPGNSGGPLVNLRGELIGINVSVYREGQGMGVGFAIPIKQVSAVFAEFFTPEAKDALWFGARVVQSGSGPLTIKFVQNGSPADTAGLRAGQRILQVNGQTPKGLVEFNHLMTANTNHQATIEVEQDGGSRSVISKLVPFDDLIRKKLGLVLLNLTPQTAAHYQFKPGQGLFIEEVEKDGPAAKAQLQRGFLLTAIDDRSTPDLISIADAISSKQPGEQVRLTVIFPRRVNNSFFEYRQTNVTVTVR